MPDLPEPGEAVRGGRLLFARRAFASIDVDRLVLAVTLVAGAFVLMLDWLGVIS